MKNKRFLATSFLIVLLSAARAWAGHVVWVDFSAFHLDAWTKGVNGNKPPKPTDLEAIKKEVLAKVSEDYATFDLTFTTVKPAKGRYTRVKILGTDGDGVGGCEAPGCCLEGDCTGIGSWDEMTESACEVYSGNSSRKSTPLCARVISPGRGMRPPPTSPACDTVWWGARKGRWRMRGRSDGSIPAIE
jgi:hypothetical protein